MAYKPLPPEELYTPCPTNRLTFKTTNDLIPLSTMVGQDRAVAAVHFSIGMDNDGYNLFALGPEGIGKATLIRQNLKEASATCPVPDDWCYANNFNNPQKPIALRLRPGRGQALRADMEQLIDELKSAIPAVFESDEYRNRKNAIEEEFSAQREKDFAELRKDAKSRGVALIRTPLGLAVAPESNGEVIDNAKFKTLPNKEKTKRKAALEHIENKLEAILHGIPKLEKELREKIRELNREVTALAVDHLIEDLKLKWNDEKDIARYLPTVREDVLENANDFLAQPEQMQMGGPIILSPGRHTTTGQSLFRRYHVNVVIDNSDLEAGARVVEEDHPTQPNLIGRIEHMSQFGTLITDFNLIRPGALHRANGGYLVLDARRLLMQPFAWETLMRTLRAGNIRIESPYESLGFTSALSLEPEPIPLKVKVILTGEPIIYYLLSRFDPDFRELFKVAADFNTEMDRDEDSAMLYARLIASDVKKGSLLPLNRLAVARVIEYGSRLAGDSEKLTAHMSSVVGLVREAVFCAKEDGKKTVTADHVQRAIDAKIYRSDRIRKYIQDEIKNGTLLIETEGARTGQINGLSVIQLDDFSFGRPSRISCTARLGRGEVVDIERQIEMGGPLHTKGVMILSSFLGSRYARETPLSLNASLVFEQSYSGVEGDSASSAELYALLSALSNIPIKQSLAVTGSVDQMGRIQAIGGVNEKIEGFFDVCNARGLDGSHGVIIPTANIRHLMLRQDVIEAAKSGKFNIYAIATIDDGMEILTGVPAGSWDEKMKSYSIGSVNHAVESQLKTFAKNASDTMRLQFLNTGTPR
ncbi:MAG: AAA family ATPase [Rhodospirillaceae bacterium]|nr:AAA family ATPase [Rhodospirillaceae bacterium]